MSLPTNAITPWREEALFGVIVKAHLADRVHQTEFEVAAAATSDATVPSTVASLSMRLAIKDPGNSVLVHYTPNDDEARHYRARHILPGSCAGDWTDYLFAKSVQLNGNNPTIDQGGNEGEQDDRTFASEGRRRNDTIYSTDGRVQSLVTVNDTNGSFGFVRHPESAQAQDADAISFATSFESPPQVTFVPQVGLTFRSTDVLSNQTIEMLAESVTVSGFDVRAKIITGSAASAITDGFSATQNATAPETGDVTLQSDGDVAYSNLEDANTTLTTYSVWYDINGTLMTAANHATIHADTNAGSTSTAWTQRASRSYNNGDNLTDESLSFAIALGADWDIRLRLSYDLAPGLNLAIAEAHGETHGTEPGVQYNKITGGSANSMTPGVGDSVAYFASEAP